MQETNTQIPPNRTAGPSEQKHFKSFWPIVGIAVMAAVVGGLVVYVVFNNNLEEDLNSLSPGSMRRKSLQGEEVRRKMMNDAQSETELLGWKTYSNEEYGFEFKYPATYTPKLGKNDIFVYSSDNISLNSPSVVYLSWESTDKDLSKIIQEKTKNISILEAAPIVFNGISAYEIVDLGMESSYAIFMKNGSYLFELNFRSGNDNGLAGNKANLSDIQKTILSTFKFTK